MQIDPKMVPHVDMQIKVQDIYSVVSAGLTHNCAINSHNQLRCWGSNNTGQANFNDEQTDDVFEVSAGGFHTCIIKREYHRQAGKTINETDHLNNINQSAKHAKDQIKINQTQSTRLDNSQNPGQNIHEPDS